MGNGECTVREYCLAHGAGSLVGRACMGKRLYEVTSLESPVGVDPLLWLVWGAVYQDGGWGAAVTLGTVEEISNDRIVRPVNFISTIEQIQSGASGSYLPVRLGYMPDSCD